MIETKALTKKFGNLLALDTLTLNIGAGEVFGFIGPNGAGKSTTMKILSCLLRADSGDASVAGFDVKKSGDDIRRVIGYMPDFLGVYEDMTVDEYLQFFAAAFRIERKKRRAVVDGVLELTDLAFKREALVDSLSRGMQQRFGIARVLIHDPKVLLLDEPASGLDPRARIEMRSLLVELGRMGKTLMVSSHILTELAEMCTSIGIIERGKLLYAGSISDAYAKVRGGERLVITLGPHGLRAEALKERLERDGRIRRVLALAALNANGSNADGATNTGRLSIELEPGDHGDQFLLAVLVEAGAHVTSFAPEEVNLEDAFLRLTSGALQ